MPPRIGDKRHVPHRVIDTWIYKVKDVEFETRDYVESDEEGPGPDERPQSERYEMQKKRVKNKLITMQLILHKKNTHSEEPPHPTEEVHFEVKCKEIDVTMEGTDIEALRAAAWDFLDKKFQIKWEYYYLVKVEHNRPWRADGTGMVFSYDGVYKGTTWDGKLLLKQYEGSKFKIKVWPGEFTDNGGNIIACIPANDLNKAALEEFCRRMDEMRKVMADYLRPARILQTLADLSGQLPFLPAPQPETKSES